MTERVSHSTIEFAAPFVLAGFDAPLAAGIYTLTTEEEGIEVAGHTVYRRTATTLRVETGGRVEHHPVDPMALESALQNDREMAARAIEQAAVLRPPPPKETSASRGKAPWGSIFKWPGSARIGKRE